MPVIPVNEFAIFIDNFIRRGQPGSTDAIFPRFMEESAIFTYPTFPVGLQWRDGSMFVETFVGGAAVLTVTDPPVPSTALRYYHAISASHDDVTARIVDVQIFNNGQFVTLASLNLTQDREVFVPRPVVIGEGGQIRARVAALAGASVLTLRTYSVAQGLGSDLPGI